MNVNVDQIRPSKYALIYTSLLIVGAMTSCDKKGDPSYEKEALRLTAAKATVEANLKTAESKLSTAENTITSLKSEIEDLKQKPIPLTKPETSTVDIEKIKLGFMHGVEKLKAGVEKQNTQHSVESVTFEKINMPTERPFSSGVVLTLKSKQDGQFTKLRWLGHGSPEGDWIFEQSAVVHDNTANKQTTNDGNNQQVAKEDKNKPDSNNNKKNTPIQRIDKNGNRIIEIRFPEDGNNGGTPPTEQPKQGARTPPGKASPTHPKQGTPPTKRPQPPKQPTDPNTHKIDWDKLKK